VERGRRKKREENKNGREEKKERRYSQIWEALKCISTKKGKASTREPYSTHVTTYRSTDHCTYNDGGKRKRGEDTSSENNMDVMIEKKHKNSRWGRVEKRVGEKKAVKIKGNGRKR